MGLGMGVEFGEILGDDSIVLGVTHHIAACSPPNSNCLFLTTAHFVLGLGLGWDGVLSTLHHYNLAKSSFYPVTQTAHFSNYNSQPCTEWSLTL